MSAWEEVVTPALEPGGELGTRANPELAIDFREVPLDRVHAHEQGVRDLPVRPALRNQRGHPLLRRRELEGADAARTDTPGLAGGPLGPGLGAQPGEDLERSREGFASIALQLRPPPDLAHREVRASE